jgi:hypothetical protein
MLFIKKSTLLLVVLAVACASSLLVVSCHNGIPKGTGGSAVTIIIPEDSSELGQRKHFIPKTEIAKFRRAFEEEGLNARNPDLFITASEGFNKKALVEILKDPKCTGIRIYYGVTAGTAKKKDLRMILVGIDAGGKDLYIKGGSPAAVRVTDVDGGLEYGQCCHEQPVE